MRTLVVYVPDWPAVAARREVNTTAPVAVVTHTAVVSADPLARAAGVVPGLRRREAQNRCPDLVLVADDPLRDAHHFEEHVRAIENTVPLVHIVRPGLVAMNARGPARFYGTEERAAHALIAAIGGDVRVGIADGLYTAHQAATRGRPVACVPVGGSPEYLAPLGVSRLGEPDIVSLLQRLGITTLGAFAALSAESVRERFGVRGALLHSAAAGLDAAVVTPRDIPVDYACEVVCDTPLTRSDEIAFVMRQPAEQFIDALGAAGYACTALRVTYRNERGDSTERSWAHPRAFGPAEVVDRVRWQLAANTRLATTTEHEGFAGDGIVLVRIEPETVAPISRYEPGLFGSAPDERIHSALARVQSILGHDGVLTVSIGGGRRLAEREVLTPWGEKPVHTRSVSAPWPGSMPSPAPATVYPTPLPVTVVGDTGPIPPAEILSEEPRALETSGRRRAIAGWAGPWPLVERWWDGGQSEWRMQVTDTTGMAWLLVSEAQEWHIEARYD